ncbi:MAG: hypothetical protein VW338_00345, partial [Rhodospirillaceae bacterium]
GEFADKRIAYAPQPGRRAVFDAEWLNRLAYRLQLAWRPTSRLDRAIVARERHRQMLSPAVSLVERDVAAR